LLTLIGLDACCRVVASAVRDAASSSFMLSSLAAVGLTHGVAEVHVGDARLGAELAPG
jgi:hypothetical protein